MDSDLVGTSRLETQFNIGVGSKTFDDLKPGNRVPALSYHSNTRPTPLVATKRSVNYSFLLFKISLYKGSVSPLHEVGSYLFLQGMKGGLRSSHPHHARGRLIKPLIDTRSQRWLVAD
jgi:hypothetical protein